MSQRVNHTSPLRMTCVAYLGRETTYQSTSISWYNGLNEQITNSSHLTISSSITVIEGHVFMESVLVACTVYSDLIGQSSCVVTNAAGQDSASWNTAYEVEPPVIIATKPANQLTEYYGNLRMTCLAVVRQEEANDTDITWWDEFGRITNTAETMIYTSRDWLLNTIFVESTLVICGVQYEHFGRISCIAENTLGRDVVTWNVGPNIAHSPPLVLLGPVNQTVDCRGRVTMTCVVNAFPSPDVWWSLNNTLVDDEAIDGVAIVSNDETTFGLNFTEAFLDICNFNDENVGYYTCGASNMFGNYTSDPGELSRGPSITNNNTTITMFTKTRSLILAYFSHIAVWIGIDFQTSPPVLPPTVTRADRTNNSDAVVVFGPLSLGVFNIAYYIANESTTPYLVRISITNKIHDVHSLYTLAMVNG